MSRILIANRGEIAIRIARTAKDLGFTTVGVFAEDDSTALHTRRVDELAPLEGSGARAYLDIDQIVAKAVALDCELVHPGYGFLSENAGLSRRCSDEGIGFVGSSADLLRLLGDKARARQVAADAGVPPIHGIDHACTLQEVRDFFSELGEGACIMIKALAGGGGRGMRRVTEAAQLEDSYRRCREEATMAFGSPDVYVEQLLPAARHIEIQIIGDGSGAVTHAWDRECTLQRRNQKLVEIAPSPTIDDATRTAMIESASRLASSIRYRGIGTVEFLVHADDPSLFAFLEVNPRVQVEHTVTEEVTGVDLVAAQIRLAGGATLAQLELEDPPGLRGYAVQARINTETIGVDGSARPSVGTVTAYGPPGSRGVRVDDCLYTGYEVNPNYDPLVAKIVATAPDYRSAIEKTRRAVGEMRLEGVASNQSLLLNLLAQEEVIENRITTSYLEDNIHRLVPGDEPEVTSPVATPTGRAVHEAPTIDRDITFEIVSPTAGTLVEVLVAAGDVILAGQTVARVEAMKMELSVDAPRAGKVTGVRAPPSGSVVDEGQVLVIVERTDSADAGPGAVTEVDLDVIRPDLAEVMDRHRDVSDDGRPEVVELRHSQGKRTARENIADLLDVGSFNEFGAMAVAAQRGSRSSSELEAMSPADGLVLGTGTVNGDLFDPPVSRCAVMAYDYTVMAGSQGFMSHKKTDRLIDVVERLRLPLVCFTEGAGGRSSDTDFPAVAALDLHTFTAFAGLSGLVPTVGIAAGNCFAGNAALFGLCDVTIATGDASIGMAGPVMVEGGGLGSFRPEEIGPVSSLASAGVVDLVVDDEAAAVTSAKRYLAYFQGSLGNWEECDQRRLRHLIPQNRKHAYEIRQVIETLADVGSVLELRGEFGRSAVTALCRIEGRPIGLIANDPRFLGGAIDSDAADKFARFVRLCAAHHLPVISLCDTPGFMVGPASESRAAVRHVSRMFAAAAHADIPFVTVVLRKAYGLGAMAMAAGGFTSPILAASWPTGEFGSMGVEGAVRIAARRQLDAIEDPSARQDRLDRLVDAEYERGRALNVASYLEIDAVIDPAETRNWVGRALNSVPGPGAAQDDKRAFIDTW